jgi:hypothetical protein
MEKIMCMMIKDKYIDPFTDFGFKHIFGTEENKHFLISFLNDLLDIDDKIIDLEYRNLEKLGLNIIDRRAIFDVYCTDEKNNNFIVDLQCTILAEDNLINEAFQVAEFLALDKDKQFAYQLDLKTHLDYKNVMDYAKEEAEKKGDKQRQLNIAKKMLGQLPDSDIAKFTGLSLQEIAHLKSY